MIQGLIEVVIEFGFQAVGWLFLKVVTLGRYSGFRPDDQWREARVDLAQSGERIRDTALPLLQDAHVLTQGVLSTGSLHGHGDCSGRRYAPFRRPARAPA